MKKALVIHPKFNVLGGGEYLCLNVIEALQKIDMNVTLLSTDYDKDTLNSAYQMNIDCEIALFEEFKPTFPFAKALQRAMFTRYINKFCNNFDLIINTQTSFYIGNYKKPTFNVFYDPSDVPLIRGKSSKYSWKLPYYILLKLLNNRDKAVRNAFNIPLSQELEKYLEEKGYKHSSYFYPPADMRFAPKPKLPRIINTTRIAPHKRLEEFIEIAKHLPEYKFLLVVVRSETERKLYPLYSTNLIMSLPTNVEYIEERIRNNPSLLEESAVYLYCSHEHGINISVAQAVGAGCIPITPLFGGGAEIVDEIMAGYKYDSIEDAVKMIREAIQWPRWTPKDLNRRSQIFSSQRFQERIQAIVS